MDAMSGIVGIDLGTTNSVVACFDGSRPIVMPALDGRRTTPSVVAFKPGEVLVGVPAKRQAVLNPTGTICSVKRLMGRTRREVERTGWHLPFDLSGRAGQPVKLMLKDIGRAVGPPEVSAVILDYLRRSAEEFLGERIARAVITVPAHFDDAQRQATRDAGRIAGLEVARIINEPTASALAYGLGQAPGRLIAVFDLGGGTFDVSILRVGSDSFEVLATAGDTRLGGDDFDAELIKYSLACFREAKGIDLSEDPAALQRVREAAEAAKCELSSAAGTVVSVPFAAPGPVHLEVKINRGRLEELTRHLIERMRGPCLLALEDAKITPGRLDDVILAGGATRMPAVKAVAEEVFGRPGHRGLDPDEIVALGAAVQAAMLSGELAHIKLKDVTPLSLGIETAGGLATPVIHRNTRIPVTKREWFSTSVDGQNTIEIRVLQGERALACDNRTLSRFKLRGVAPALKGQAQIEVGFTVDEDGILSVRARDKAGSSEKSLSVEGSNSLPEEEIQSIIEEASRYRQRDQAQRRLIELATTARERILLLERASAGEETGRSRIVQRALSTLRAAVESNDIGRLEQALEIAERVVKGFVRRYHERSQSDVPPDRTHEPDRLAETESRTLKGEGT